MEVIERDALGGDAIDLRRRERAAAIGAAIAMAKIAKSTGTKFGRAPAGCGACAMRGSSACMRASSAGPSTCS